VDEEVEEGRELEVEVEVEVLSVDTDKVDSAEAGTTRRMLFCSSET
jgi:hypothetical protein